MDNCLTFAWRTWRYTRTSDHLVIRKSLYGWFPHFQVLIELQDGTLVKKEFVPIKPVRKWFPPLFFKGEIKTTYYKKE